MGNQAWELVTKRTPGWLADNDASTKATFQHRIAVSIGTANEVKIPDGSGVTVSNTTLTERPVGPLANNPAAGKPAVLDEGGVVICMAGEALATPNVRLTYDTQGRVIDDAPSAATKRFTVGWLRTTCAAAGELVSVDWDVQIETTET